MNELLAKLKNLNTTDTTKIETNELTIKNNTIITNNNSIQIHNISMIFKNEFKSPVSLKDYIILLILLISCFIPIFTPVGIVLFLLYAFGLYSKHKQHLEDKYYIVFNLGSSQNYYLYFKNSAFRDQVFEAVTQSFDNATKTNLTIDIKNEKIENQTIFEPGSSQTNISGNNNVLGNNNLTAHNGDVISNSNVLSNSEDSAINVNNKNSLPWNTLTEELKNIISENQKLLSEEVITVFKQLLDATEKQNEKMFNTIKSENKELFSTTLVKDILTGMTSSILASLLIK